MTASLPGDSAGTGRVGEQWTREQETAQIEMGKPHLVILGAGASLAAFPDGERNGKVLPLMKNFVDVLGLADFLEDAQVEYKDRNFEDVYAQIHDDESLGGTRESLETAVHDFFSGMELPELPTLYDHLILSLREKDVIATFNWDPFLIQACQRNSPGFGCPRLLFLHGNVLSGFCENDYVAGVVGSRCGTCGRPFKASQLLYPVAKKDYHKDPFISAQWEDVARILKNAFMVTILGYGAPASDASAIALFQDAWGASSKRAMEEIEIINIEPEEKLRQSWDAFIHSHHYQTRVDFFDSWIARHPRRTGEAYINQFLEARYIESNPAPRLAELSELQAWYRPLRNVELLNRAS